MAGKVRHLQERAGRYFARLGVPKELREFVGKRELLEALGADRTTALRKLPAAVARMQATLEAARERLAKDKAGTAPPRRGKPMTIQQIALDHFKRQIRFDEELRNTDERYASFGFHPDDEVADLKRAVTGAASNAELEAIVGRIVVKYQSAGHTSVTRYTPEWRKLAMALAVAELEATYVAMDRDEGIPDKAPAHPLLQEPEPLTVPSSTSPRIIGPNSTKPLSEVLEDFRKEKRSRPGTDYEYEVAVRMFEEFLGEPRPVHAITKQDIVDYKNALLDTPANYTKRFEGMTLPAAIKANKARATPFPTLNPTTINDKWLSRLRSILGYCASNNIIPDNPAAGIKVANVEDDEKRKPFTSSDLSKIFAPPLFSPGSPLGEKEWMMLIALHTGLRASEIAQIKLDSIRRERGILVFAIEEETKNVGSKRLTPVHSTLLALGLEKRIADLRESGKIHLFPEWFAQGEALKAGTRKVNQPFPNIYPRWFNRTYLPKIGIHDPKKKFHSFRHTLKTALARAGVSRSISDDITGHDDSSAGGKYIHETSIEAMKAAIEKIHFDELNLLETLSVKEAA